MFMHINENIRNERKIAGKIMGVPTKLLLSQPLIALEYLTWHQLNAKK